MNLPNLNEARKRTDNPVSYLENERIISEKYSSKKYFLRTYGCQMNVHDSEEIRQKVEDLGFTPCDKLEDADLVILNTCAIRNNVHDKVFGYLSRAKHLKTKKDLIIAITGCMSQQEDAVLEIKEKHPYIDIVIGTHNINDLPKMLLEYKPAQNINVYSIEGNVVENILYKRDSIIKAWINIMLGCNNFCTYCIVPYTRGKRRSRKHEEILQEIKDLKEKGYQEVTLLGQNVNSYGLDLEGEISFAKLLEEVAKTSIPRIRFVTSNSWDFSDEMIEVIAKYTNIMPYIHLPIQSGSNKILKKMNRPYTKESYLELFNKIKSKIPGVAVTTDIIVGFPGETEEDFLETISIVNECQFDGAYTFIFSPRVGTPASLLEDDIELSEKEKRLQRLNETVNKYSKENNKKYLNKVVKVLVEGISEKDPNKVFGYTEEMKLVNFLGSKDIIGKIVEVKITATKSFSLDGELLEKVGQ